MRNRWELLLLVLIMAIPSYAATPASVYYLNNKMAVIQAEIDAIRIRVNGM